MYDIKSFDKLSKRDQVRTMPPVIDGVFVCPPVTWSLPMYMQRRTMDIDTFNLLHIDRRCDHNLPYICNWRLCSKEKWNSQPFIGMRFIECKKRLDNLKKRNNEFVKMKHTNKRVRHENKP